MNRVTSAIVVLLALLTVVLLAILAVSIYDLQRADCCSEMEGIAESTKCVRAAATAWHWRNEVNRLWHDELDGKQPDCDEFNWAVDNLSDAAEIPRAGLRQGGIVWIVTEKNRLRFKKVEIARFKDGSVIIKSGFDADETVVVSPLKVVTDGMKVRAVPMEEGNGS